MKKGADVVKQWDSTLDGRTRESHTWVDGEIRELDKPFSNGLDFPGDPAGGAAEVINCRCALLQRARWALDEDELEELKRRAEYFGLDKTANFEDYKKKYLKAADAIDDVSDAVKINNFAAVKSQSGGIIEMMADINKMITPYERKILDTIPKKEGFFDFAAHGLPNAIEYGSADRKLSARDVANIIRHNKGYNGQKVRLLSCSTGSTDDGFAQQLANALGVEVEAPTDILYVYSNGTYKVGLDGSGTMKTFKPGRKE